MAVAMTGGNSSTGKEATLVQQAMNLAMIDMVNRRVPLSAISRRVITIQPNCAIYYLSADVIDVVNVLTRQFPVGVNRLVSSLTNPLSTVSGSPTVTVACPNHGAQVQDPLLISQAVAAGGLTLSGTVYVASIVDANTFTITWTSNATSTANSGGGAVTLSFYGTIDLTVQRISRDTYYGLTPKGSSGLPQQYYLDRQITPTLYFWPNPNNNAQQFVCACERRIEDISSMQQNFELPFRFLPLMVAGAANFLGQFRPTVGQARRAELAGKYEQALMAALTADRDSGPLLMGPDMSSYSTL